MLVPERTRSCVDVDLVQLCRSLLRIQVLRNFETDLSIGLFNCA